MCVPAGMYAQTRTCVCVCVCVCVQVHLAEWEYERGHRKSCAVKLASFRTSDDSVFRQFMREIEVMCQVPRHKVCDTHTHTHTHTHASTHTAIWNRGAQLLGAGAKETKSRGQASPRLLGL